MKQCTCITQVSAERNNGAWRKLADSLLLVQIHIVAEICATSKYCKEMNIQSTFIPAWSCMKPFILYWMHKSTICFGMFPYGLNIAVCWHATNVVLLLERLVLDFIVSKSAVFQRWIRCLTGTVLLAVTLPQYTIYLSHDNVAVSVFQRATILCESLS